ncbi:vesicule-associated membrane protein, putative [Trypanosoma cruzi]|uniref:Vesicule-associated membrane protein, putative n=3 Tax=Trypanosoma cruzi TaxID=5693 RepID=Q4E1T0_TRYCC|nr:vesicule-associated membrane protein, putative [Trypanosoma cruzi]ESS67104.1 vesicule-associated membrane protein [Trypanosoma cruzi Dm28c]EAN98723.1 vesicule-associated membrane protein, putative [Trypanosoma cruzi]EKF99819.1 vesicule-associated membrane protein, putative [Trypanosoma cruzi]KAF8290322.1 putative vesicle-associated membrane protein [Trypanosoma cruzi]PWU91426.1 putative vesicle-associated membrane protein [Trypanosoma cruzi]|eukprot:XP_820574.1 vesicule-associated membrane protein [Trypanosoma cruzi strain CL Brener]
MHMQGETKIYGGVLVRLSDRLMLCKAPGCPTNDFSIPGTVWAEVVSKCSAPNFRTTSFISLDSEGLSGVEEGAEGPLQLSYHIMTDSELAFAILANKAVTRRQGHAALDEAAKTFRKMFVESVAKLNTKMVDVFVKPYRDVLLRMSDSGEPEEKVRKVKMAVAEVKDLALDNVERVIQRGQRIDDIVQSTEDLQFQAQGFQRSSRDLRQQLWWNSVKGKLMVGGVAAFFIMIVLFVFFSGNGNSK